MIQEQTSAVQGEYQKKRLSISEATKLVKDRDHIVSAMAAAEPIGFLSQLHMAAEHARNITVSTCLPMLNYDYFTNEQYFPHFKMEGWFYTSAIRNMQGVGHVSYIPNHLHFAGTKRLAHRSVQIFAGSASRMDKNGYLSLSLSATYEREMMAQADIVLLEVNENMPRTFGDTIVHIRDVDYIVEHHAQIPQFPSPEPNEKDKLIGAAIATHIEDGSTLQLGIGGIPNAVAANLTHKKNLGIHTEMLTDGMVDLVEAGVITGCKKTLHPHRMVATFALGTDKLYRFLDDNPGVLMLNGNWVNDPAVIGQNEKMISINTTLEIDLTGQCSSESLGHRQYSGTGGQTDTAVGAQRSPGGKSFIALYSTAMVKNHETGHRERKSKIVPALAEGSAVTLSRNDVDYVVTEYGAVSLRGTSLDERVERLISIAHPDFRETLALEAKKRGIVR
ncbi:acetyl-CoA hydrolase/transferase family protein [Shouchella sp. JSM 1781072]|uniref:acetyl-CoA hydrolase/transferase family protein n=1 Tax=Shouchella sp. JSM 1781072 TaxID=3344581 RepID=UPI0035C0D8F7